jgi:mannose-6-phosphate isomerase-like protein (cupin superfamily)
MPKMSMQSASQVQDFGAAEDRSEDLGGYTTQFVSIRETHDLTQMLSGLPGGHCRCPHWGYVIEGRMTVRYDDHDEVIEAGEAYYLPPGHVPGAEAGSRFVMISPTEEYEATMAAVAASMAGPADG